ncbi:hypothetical protein [Roseiflexus castenholzii]|uniref:hypothetical protein n=1 Tax=Roseiflexus castenholzii TaxID=120962 RepID=UPI0012EE216C|nr:hypothetical protein [Roseiflexus castenholzii]
MSRIPSFMAACSGWFTPSGRPFNYGPWRPYAVCTTRVFRHVRFLGRWRCGEVLAVSGKPMRWLNGIPLIRFQL